jgi:hypothetical protein
MTLTKSAIDVPVMRLIVRGRELTDHLVEMTGRGDEFAFLAPDTERFLDVLPLRDPGKLADLYAISFDDILDYLVELGTRLNVRANLYMQQARALSYHTSPQTPPLVDAAFAMLPQLFQRENLIEVAEKSIGIAYLEGWVPTRMQSGATVTVRCFGARCVHIVPGNALVVSAITIIRNALLRSDAIIKAPSNDPFTAWAIAKTMCDMAPDHPITRHLSVAYWRGGNTAFEEKLYQPQNVEKIIAWGGFASIKHVTRYIQPGLELISLDPKNSTSIVGAAAFDSETSMRDAAIRIATDAGATNQNACANARVVYVVTGTDEEGLAKANALGRHVYDELMHLPSSLSTKPKRYSPDLADQVDALRLDDEWFRVIGGRDGEGAVIVSQLAEAVNFAAALTDRTINIVPIDTLDEVLATVNAYTQTVGIFPEELKGELINVLPLYGAQRIVSLGYACAMSTMNSNAHDGLEPLRRMGKWIVNDISSPELVPPMWACG